MSDYFEVYRRQVRGFAAVAEVKGLQPTNLQGSGGYGAQISEKRGAVRKKASSSEAFDNCGVALQGWLVGEYGWKRVFHQDQGYVSKVEIWSDVLGELHSAHVEEVETYSPVMFSRRDVSLKQASDYDLSEVERESPGMLGRYLNQLLSQVGMRLT